MILVSMYDHLNEQPIYDALISACTGFEIEARISGSSVNLINQPCFGEKPYNTVTEYLSALIAARKEQPDATQWYLFINIRESKSEDISVLYRAIVQSGVLNGIRIVIGNYTTYTSLFYLTYRSALNLAVRDEFSGCLDYVTFLPNE